MRALPTTPSSSAPALPALRAAAADGGRAAASHVPCGAAPRPAALAPPRGVLHRRPTLATAATAASQAGTASDYAALAGVSVLRPADGVAVDLLSQFKAGPGDRTILLFLTHAADLAPWELVPRVVKALPALRAAGVGVVMTVLGSAANAREFQARLSIPDGVLFADPAAATHDALGFSKGFDPAGPVKLPPYVRLAAMLAGVGSPGTMAEVARGYLGDRAAPQVFPSGPFDVLGTGYQRPMELATLRLNSMISVLSDWKNLAPPDDELLTRLGGALVLRGRETAARHADSGILKYADWDALVAAAGVKELPP